MGEFAVKVSPFGGSTAGELWAGEDAGLRKGVAGTYTGRRADQYRSPSRPILLRLQSSIAPPTDHYRSQQLLREVGGSEGAVACSEGTLRASIHEVVSGASWGAFRMGMDRKKVFPKIFREVSHRCG